MLPMHDNEHGKIGLLRLAQPVEIQIPDLEEMRKWRENEDTERERKWRERGNGEKERKWRE